MKIVWVEDEHPVPPQVVQEPALGDITTGTGIVDPYTFFVRGHAPHAPVMRPLRQPLYDTEKLIDPETNFFTDIRRRDGSRKTATETNMTQVGQLGYPLEFDLTGFNVVPENSQEGWRAFENSWFKFVFGHAQRWLEIPLRVMVPALATPAVDGHLTIETGENDRFPVYRYGTTMLGQQARRISSTESFRGIIGKDYTLEPALAPLFTVLMTGALLTYL